MSSYFECPRCDFSCRTASSLRDHENWGGCRREEGASSIDGEENLVNFYIGDTDEEPIPLLNRWHLLGRGGVDLRSNPRSKSSEACLWQVKAWDWCSYIDERCRYIQQFCRHIYKALIGEAKEVYLAGPYSKQPKRRLSEEKMASTSHRLKKMSTPLEKRQVLKVYRSVMKLLFRLMGRI